MHITLARLIRDERGATSIEYALLATLLAIACIGSFYAFADSLNVLWGFVGGKVSGAMGS